MDISVQFSCICPSQGVCIENLWLYDVQLLSLEYPFHLFFCQVCLKVSSKTCGCMGLSCCHWNITFTFLFSSLPQNFPENWLYGIRLVSLKYHLHYLFFQVWLKFSLKTCDCMVLSCCHWNITVTFFFQVCLKISLTTCGCMV